MIKLKRVYEPATKDDGFRVLVDRLWPRGVSKINAQLDLWLKEIAPSNELRQWFQHDPKKWSGFQKKYQQEITDNPVALTKLKELVKKEKVVTILFGAKDEEHNEAVVLKNLL